MKRFGSRKKEISDTNLLVPVRKTIDPPQVNWTHSWALHETQDALSASPFMALSTEMLLHIFRFLSVSDLCHVSLVCRSFKMVADQDEIWKPKCNTSTKLHSKSFKQIYLDWMYEKYLRIEKLRQLTEELQQTIEIFSSSAVGRTACLVRGYEPSPSNRITELFDGFKAWVQEHVKHVMKKQNDSVDETKTTDVAGNSLENHVVFTPQRKRNDKNHRDLSGSTSNGFSQHPNSSQEMTIELSVDIDKTSYQLISMLEKISQLKEKWYVSNVLKQMITRYYRFMQLKAIHFPNILLIPTLDIELVWQTHLLRPEMYQADCLRLFHRVIDHSLLLTDIQASLKDQAFTETCQLYEQTFGEQYCQLPLTKSCQQEATNKVFHTSYVSKDLNSDYSYWDTTLFNFSSDPPQSYENPFSFTEADLTVDGLWLNFCKQFMADSPELFNSLWWRLTIERLKKSYERFLYLAAKYPVHNSNEFVPPTYAIDIMWHAHMQEPLNYAADCMRLVGYVIPHAPWPVVEDETMKMQTNKTDAIWKREFQSEILTDHLYPNHADNIG